MDADKAFARQITGSALGNLALSVSSRVLGLLVSVLLARSLGAGGFGIYSSVLAVLSLLSVPATLGLPTLVVRLVATYLERGQWSLLRGLLSGSMSLVSLAALFVVAISVLVLPFLPIDTSYSTALLFGLIALPLSAFGAIRSSTLRGLHYTVLGQVPDSLVIPLAFILLLLLREYLPISDSLSPELAVLLRTLAIVVSFIIGVWVLVSRLPKQLRDVDPNFDAFNWSRSALPLLAIGGMTVLNSHADVLMLATLRGAESAGIYQAATRGAELVAFSLIVINMAIQPSIAKIFATGDLILLQRLVTTAARVSFLLALPVALTFMIVGEDLLTFAFGIEFASGWYCLIVLCIGQLVNAAAGPVVLILNMIGSERDTALGILIGVSSNLVLNVILIPLWDVTGAAFATSASLIIWNVILVRSVSQRTGGVASTILGKRSRSSAKPQ